MCTFPSRFGHVGMMGETSFKITMIVDQLDGYKLTIMVISVRGCGVRSIFVLCTSRSGWKIGRNTSECNCGLNSEIIKERASSMFNLFRMLRNGIMPSVNLFSSTKAADLLVAYIRKFECRMFRDIGPHNLDTSMWNVSYLILNNLRGYIFGHAASSQTLQEVRAS